MTPDNKPAGNKNAISASERKSSSWDVRNAPRNYLSLVLTQIGSAAFSFAAVWIITRYLGSEGYGGIVAIIAASQVAQVFVNWTSVAMVRFGVDEYIETQRIARTFWVRLTVLIINFAVVAALASFWFPPLARWLKLSPEAFWLVLIHFAVSAFWIHFQMSLQAAKMLRLQGLLMMVERAAILGGLVVLVAAANLTATTAIVCYIVGPAMMIAAGVGALRNYIFADLAVDAAFLKKIFAYSIPLLPFSLVGYLSGSYIDAIFVSGYLSTRDLGIYSIATQISGIAMQLPTLANTLLLPLFVTLQKESGSERSQNYFKNILPTITLLGGLSCVLLALITYFFVPLIFGGEFSGATIPLWILLAACAITIPVALGYSPFTNATSRTNIAMMAAIVSAVVNVASNALLIPRYGLLGCAAATLFAYFSGFFVYALALRLSAQIPPSWSFVAVLPSLGSVVLLIIYQNPWWAAATGLMISLLIGYLFKDSVRQVIPFMKRLGGGSV